MLPAMPVLFSHARVEGGGFPEIPVPERKGLMTQYGQDEILELLWTLKESGRNTRAELLLATAEESPEALIEELQAAGQVEVLGEEVRMTRSGEERARGIIRRHRLAEVLLHNLFEIENQQLESSACQFEHILSETVTESVCTFLGHPPQCPHGRPIPRGLCCDRIRTDLRPLVTRLSDASLGAPVRIVFITPKSKKRLEKLSSLGIVPGSSIRLMQRNPSHVLQIGQTTVAVDKDITDEIFVKLA
jgi:DtxR family Mn-dependent transcriptional regulator